MGRPFTDLAATGLNFADRHVFNLIRGIARVTLSHHRGDSLRVAVGAAGAAARAVADNTRNGNSSRLRRMARSHGIRAPARRSGPDFCMTRET
jgi:hypothetical protein